MMVQIRVSCHHMDNAHTLSPNITFHCSELRALKQHLLQAVHDHMASPKSKP